MEKEEKLTLSEKIRTKKRLLMVLALILTSMFLVVALLPGPPFEGVRAGFIPASLEQTYPLEKDINDKVYVDWKLKNTGTGKLGTADLPLRVEVFYREHDSGNPWTLIAKANYTSSPLLPDETWDGTVNFSVDPTWLGKTFDLYLGAYDLSRKHYGCAEYTQLEAFKVVSFSAQFIEVTIS